MTPVARSREKHHDPEKCWIEFRTALDNASIQVRHNYFQIPRYAAEDAWRERAYCYELYHQLRLQLGDIFPYTLHGEIDKAGHEWVVKNFGKRSRPNPDFIVHVPKTPDNLAIMEVKTSDTDKELVIADLKKAMKFMQCGYRHAIMLLFGASKPAALTGFNDIEVLWHAAVGTSPEYHAGLKLTPPFNGLQSPSFPCVSPPR